MTQTPLGAQLSPVDLPPPPPGSDPREPSPTLTPRQRGGSRTPHRPHSPLASRDASPVRPIGQGRSHSSELGTSPPSANLPPLQHPIPKSSGTPSSSIPIHHAPHLSSRPSSPSSIHSSGSAIFERDIEFPPVASLSTPNQPHTLNHKSSRLSHLSHGSTLDHTVPAVLDDAVEALTASTDGLSRGFEGLEIEAPAPAPNGIGMARQSSSSLPRKISSSGPHPLLHSRSPSPVSVNSSIASPATSPPILGQLHIQQAPGGVPGQSQVSPTAGIGESGLPGTVPRPAMPPRMSTGPQVPGGWMSAFGGVNSQPASTSPVQPEPINTATATSREPLDEHASSPNSDGSNSAPNSTLTPSSIPSHISPNKNRHRISYLSYNDLLSAVPTKVTSLEDITSGNLSPDHLPGTVSPSMSTRSPTISPHNPLSPSLLGEQSPAVGAGATSPPKSLQPKSSFDAHRSASLGGLGLGEGEWEREGLGKGLEQRLEEVAQGQGQGQTQ
ncbi:uncharacterized protein I303_101045 [Kwoniella dejecticola CBS 10117]|uniref:Uncharacterized protein n=1 Tax=Kwoniella dejecticola CBS 10117 TaxID=1296121 RepID=A0A1A6AGN5_9TREE|nr:uncharacterized protein I303_01047 [Kwoniella dejecticola CBS 10117]OBR89222.1 hypothetical protein I303_01047 [Kwoniella dejecticola CBS 10117]